MTKPLISVCIPVFNGEKYLKACLDSCIVQNYVNFEIVICDDVSTDGSRAIIEEYCSQNSKIKFFTNKQNLGLVGNWNTCMEKANGEWIKFLFQDDLMNINCLEKFMEHASDSTQLVVCKRNFVIDKIATEKEQDYYINRVRTLENTGYFNSTNFSSKVIATIFNKNISMNFIGEPSLSFFRKSLIRDIGSFDRDLKQICDLEFLLRVASNYGLKYIPEQLCSFRIHDSSTTEKNINSDNYYIINLEGLNYALKVLTKKEFSKLRHEIGSYGLMRLKIYAKYRFYKAFVAIKSNEDKDMYNKFENDYHAYSFKSIEIPFLKLLVMLR